MVAMQKSARHSSLAWFDSLPFAFSLTRNAVNLCFTTSKSQALWSASGYVTQVDNFESDFSTLRFLGSPFARNHRQECMGLAFAFHIPEVWTAASPPEDWRLNLQ